MKKQSPIKIITTNSDNKDQTFDPANNNGDQTFDLSQNGNLCDQLFDKMLQMPTEFQTRFDYSIGGKGQGIKLLKSGDIEITPAHFQILIRPKKS